MFIQGVLGLPSWLPRELEGRPAEAEQPSDLLFHCRDDRI